MDPITVVAISEGTKQATKALVDSIVNPIISRIKLVYKKSLIGVNEHFQEYLLRNYEKYSTMNTLVFSNTQKKLKDIYIPLSITTENSKNGKTVIRKIDAYPKDIIDKYKKVLIVDTAGMGKSTLMKYIYLSIVDDEKGIPIFIELRRLNSNKDIFDEIQEQLNSITEQFDRDLLTEFIKDGKLIFILDGYDEIPLTDKEIVTKKMQDFINKANGNSFFMTSRPEETLSCFGDFVKFEINPLLKEEAFELLRKYDNTKDTSDLLIKQLNNDSEAIDDFLKNPLLVSLLYKAFDYKQAIPLKKHLFYRQVFDAFFDAHDLSKGDSFIRKKNSKLDSDEFHRVLRYIGYNSLKKIEFTKDELLLKIKESKFFCKGLSFSESDLLKDLLNTVPIFVKDGIYYKWAHKSLQEYFAAQFIFLDAKKSQSCILDKLYNSKDLDKYYNLLDLYYNIDYKGFRENITYNYLTEFKVFCSKLDSTVANDLKKCYSILFKGIPFIYMEYSAKRGKKQDPFDRFHLISECIKTNYENTQHIFVDSHFRNGFFIDSSQKYVITYSHIANKKNILLNILSEEDFVCKMEIEKRLSMDLLDKVEIELNTIFTLKPSESNFIEPEVSNLSIINNLLEILSTRYVKNRLDYDRSMKEVAKIESERRDDNTDSLLNCI